MCLCACLFRLFVCGLSLCVFCLFVCFVVRVCARRCLKVFACLCDCLFVCVSIS